MSVGLYNIDTKDFIEISTGFIVGKGDGCNLSVSGEAEPKQAQFLISETGTYLLNLNTKNDVLVNMKRLPERFYIPLEADSLIIVGDESFIFSLSGPPKSFRLNEIIESYEDSSPSDYDATKLKTANSIQDQIDKLKGGLPDFLKSAGGIKEEIGALLAERKTLEAKIKGIDTQINELKEKFEANKKEINPIAEQIKEKQNELGKILKEIAAEKGASKLELDL